MFKLPIPKNSRNYSLKQANILLLEDSPAKDYLLSGDLTCLPEETVTKVSMKLWKEFNDGEWLNIQSKKQLGEITFDYLKGEAVV